VSSGADSLNWLMNRFATSVPLVRQAVVVSSDGLAMASSDDTVRRAGLGQGRSATSSSR